jgi:hypothetical protein
MDSGHHPSRPGNMNRAIKKQSTNNPLPELVRLFFLILRVHGAWACLSSLDTNSTVTRYVVLFVTLAASPI